MSESGLTTRREYLWRGPEAAVESVVMPMTARIRAEHDQGRILLAPTAISRW